MKAAVNVVDNARMRYLQAKNDMESLIFGHMSLSTRLLRHVRSSVNALYNGFTTHSQSTYVRSLNANQNAAADDLEEPMDIMNGFMLPSFPHRGDMSVSNTKQMTQAEWITQTSTVHSSLSKIACREDPVKIPEILLTDPADVLSDTKAVLQKDQKEEKDMLSKLLDDTSYEIALEADITNSYRNASLFASNMASVLDYTKTEEPREACGVGRQMVNTMVNDTFRGLETLSHEWPTTKVVVAKPNDTPLGPSDKLNEEEKEKVSNIETLYMKMFGTKSGLLNSDKNHKLTHALLHINEMDRKKEAELAPKMCTTKPTKEGDKAIKSQNVRFTSSDGVASYSHNENKENINILEGITILSADRFGIKMNKMSDFERSFLQQKYPKGQSVEVQTEEQMPPQLVEEETPQKYGNIRVVYSGKKNMIPGIREIAPRSQMSASQTAADTLASGLVDNVEPRLLDTNRGPPIAEDYTAPSVRHIPVLERREMYQKQLLEMEKADRERWREMHHPLYEKIHFNERCGLRMSGICRGGRKGGSRLTRRATTIGDEYGSSSLKLPITESIDESKEGEGKFDDLGNSSDHPSTLIYESPSARVNRKQSLVYESPSSKMASLTRKDSKLASPRKLGTDNYSVNAPFVTRGYYGYDDLAGTDGNDPLSSNGKPFFASTTVHRKVSKSLKQAMPTSSKDMEPNKQQDAPYKNAFMDFEGWWRQTSLPLGSLREQLSI